MWVLHELLTAAVVHTAMVQSVLFRFYCKYSLLFAPGTESLLPGGVLVATGLYVEGMSAATEFCHRRAVVEVAELQVLTHGGHVLVIPSGVEREL